MEEVSLLVNIAVALVVAFVGGIIARRIGLPSIVGYLLAGIAIGPFTPGFVGDTETISQLAEMGVIFLMFGVGLHFSLRDLSKVRGVAVPGALSRMLLVTLLGLLFGLLSGWSIPSGIVVGLAVSVASTVVLLRSLTDHGLLSSPDGQTAIGWVIVEDLATVLILVLMPALANPADSFDWLKLTWTLIKAAVFVLVVLFAGMRLIPWILLRIAHTRSRELFILAILAIALGIALGAAEIFGVSLALGAFVAGVVVGQSPLSHQAGADILPFREAFAVLFFVSIGMLVNPRYLVDNTVVVLSLTGVIVLGKGLLTLLLAALFGWQTRTAVVLAAALSQIGEFSFILGQEALGLGLIERGQYSLILAGALLSITLNPLMFRAIGPLERLLQRLPPLARLMDRNQPEPFLSTTAMQAHVVMIGFGRVGQHIASLLDRMSIPYLVIDMDPQHIESLRQRGVPSLFGDASNSELLTHAGLQDARALVVAGPDEAASELAVAAARDLAPQLSIIARATTEDGTHRLTRLGAQHVIHAELEGGLEIVRHTLLQLGLPAPEINRYADAVRRDHYDLPVNTEEEHRLLHDLLDAAAGIEIAWFRLAEDSPLVGRSLREANLRDRTGASVVAVLRDGELMANPKSGMVFQAGDRVGLIGDEEEIEEVAKSLASPGKDSSPSPSSRVFE